MRDENVATEFARKCPTYATGTVLLKDEAGHIVGYARVKRVGEGAMEVTFSSSPETLSLSQARPQTGA